MQVGRLGTESMSGVAIVNQLLFVFNLTIFGGLAGASIFGAQFYGKGDHKGVRYALRFKLIFSVLMAVIAIVALLFFNNPLISLFLTESESGGDLVLTLSEAKNYLFVMLIGLIPFSFSQSYSSTLRETGETVSPMTRKSLCSTASWPALIPLRPGASWSRRACVPSTPRTRPSWQRRICAITPPFAGGRRRTEPCLKRIPSL